MTENTIPQITAAEKDAYNKGWASQAKTLDGALVGAEKKYGAGDALINFFTDGYVDKNEGNPKWDSLQAKQLEAAAESAPTLVLVDDVVIAETRKVDLAAEAAADLEEEDADEQPAEAPAPKAEIIPEDHPSILSMLREAAAEKDKEQRSLIRAEIAVKKNHYKMGWNSAQSPLFKGHDDAQAGYLKRRPESPYLGDWEAGYADNAEGAEYGTAWKELVSDENRAALAAEISATE